MFEDDGKPGLFGYREAAVVRTKEEGELKAYIENVGHPPNNLEPSHSAYKLWTYKNARSGNVLNLIHDYQKSL